MSRRDELSELLQENITDSLPIDPSRGEIQDQVELAVQHVLAAGWVKLPFDDATVERAARALHPRTWNDKAWVPVYFGETAEERRAILRAESLEAARAVLAAAVKEEQA